MREGIGEFRAKRLDNQEWIYGYLLKFRGKWHIQNIDDERDCAEVIPETIGEFTGVFDKNRVRVYENNDIKTWHYYYGKNESGEKILKKEYSICKVFKSQSAFCYSQNLYEDKPEDKTNLILCMNGDVEVVENS